MKAILKACLSLLAPTMLAVMPATHARADFPERPVTLIVGFPAGSANDVFARLLSPGLSARLGQPVVVENKPGANGTLAAKFVAKTAPDGYTISLSGLSNVINAILKPETGIKLSDITWVAMIGRYSNVIIVPKESELRTVDDLVAYAKANPGKLSCGSGGVGASPHLSCELFKAKTGVDIKHVPYASSPAITDLIGGRLSILFDSIQHAKPFIDEGKVRPLAVLGPQRNDALPDVPTLRELNYDIATTTWTGIVSSPGVPEPVVEKLNAAFRDTLSSPDIAAKMTALGVQLDNMSVKDLQALAKTEESQWADIFRPAGLIQ